MSKISKITHWTSVRDTKTMICDKKASLEDYLKRLEPNLRENACIEYNQSKPAVAHYFIKTFSLGKNNNKINTITDVIKHLEYRY